MGTTISIGQLIILIILLILVFGDISSIKKKLSTYKFKK